MRLYDKEELALGQNKNLSIKPVENASPSADSLSHFDSLTSGSKYKLFRSVTPALAGIYADAVLVILAAVSAAFSVRFVARGSRLALLVISVVDVTGGEKASRSSKANVRTGVFGYSSRSFSRNALEMPPKPSLTLVRR